MSSRDGFFNEYVEVDSSPRHAFYTKSRKIGSKIYYQGDHMPIHVGSIVRTAGREYTVLDKRRILGATALTVRERD